MKAFIGKIIIALVPALLFTFVSAAAQDQQQKMPDFVDLAEKEADRLQSLLDLNDYQLFYVDSTLKHDYIAMTDELQKLQQSKVSNSSLYISVQDKWMDAIDNSYRKIFNDEQWELYMKNGASKAQKAREKRKEKADKALENL